MVVLSGQLLLEGLDTFGVSGYALAELGFDGVGANVLSATFGVRAPVAPISSAIPTFTGARFLVKVRHA
jgi:hypothetical protein